MTRGYRSKRSQEPKPPPPPPRVDPIRMEMFEWRCPRCLINQRYLAREKRHSPTCEFCDLED